jgi:uncharacterized membrane protein YphA (DoxX/SURF4 family)
MVSGAQALERDYHADLDLILDTSQREQGPLPASASSTLQTVDRVLMVGMVAVGGCLIVGLLTRLAAVAGAMFLLSVAISQPFWLAESAPTVNQLIEMIALLTLATTTVGRWAGLDFFIHHLLVRSAEKGNSHELES